MKKHASSDQTTGAIRSHMPSRKPLAKAMAVALSLAAASAHAALININSDQDVTADDGLCTLREAIVSANTDTKSGDMVGECPRGEGADTVSFTDYLVLVTAVTLNSDSLQITSPVTFETPHICGTTISGGNSVRVFEVTGGGATATFNNITITGGSCSGTD